MIVEILHPLLSHLVLLDNVVLHIFRLISNFLHHFFFIGDPDLLLLDETLLDVLELSADWVQVVIMILDTVLPLLVDPALSLVHPSVVGIPLLLEDFCFLVHLALEVIAKVLEL